MTKTSLETPSDPLRMLDNKNIHEMICTFPILLPKLEFCQNSPEFAGIQNPDASRTHPGRIRKYPDASGTHPESVPVPPESAFSR